MDDHDDSMVDALVGGGDVSLSSHDILKWSEGVSVHVPDLSDIRERTERSLDMRELNSVLDEVVPNRRLSTGTSSAHSNPRVSSPLALPQHNHYSQAHAPTLDALEGRGPTPSSATVGQAGSSTAGSVKRSSSLRNSLRNSLRDSLRDSLRHSLRQSLRESLRHSRRDSADTIDEQLQSTPAQALRTSTNTRSSASGPSGLGASSFSTPSSMHRSSRSSYRERLETEIPLSLRKSPAAKARLSPTVRLNALDSPALRHARRGSSPFLTPCAPDASMLDATFHPPEIGDRTYDVLETAVTTNTNRRRTMGLQSLRTLVAESEARMSPSPSPAAPTFPLSDRNLDVPERSAAIMDKSTFIRRIREESESPLKEASLLDTKSFALTPPQERRDTLAPLPSAGRSRFTQPAPPRFQQNDLPNQTDRTLDLGRLVNRQQEASRLPGADSIMGPDLADLSIDSEEELVPASLRPKPLPPSSSMRNLSEQLEPRTITEQLREREQQRELARARSHARLNSMSSMRSLNFRTPRKERPEDAEVPLSLRKERPSAPATTGRRTSTMTPSNGLRAGAASRGPLGFPRSASARDLALGTGPSRMSAPATTEPRRTLPPSESVRRLSALPSSASSRRLSAIPSSSIPDIGARRQSTLTRRQSMLPPRNDRAEAANERNQPSRTSTISRAESTQSVRRQSTLSRADSRTSRGEPESSGGRKSTNPPEKRSSLLSRANSTGTRRLSVLPRSESAQSQERERSLRPSASAVLGERKAGLPRSMTSRNLATSPVKRASAPATTREALHARRSLAPAPSAPSAAPKRRSMLPSTRSTTALRKLAETPASKAPEREQREPREQQSSQPPSARTRSDTTSAVSATPSTVPSLCSAPTIDSHSPKLSAPPSEADVEWLSPLPEAFEKPALTQPKSVLRPKPSETMSRLARRESRPNLASTLAPRHEVRATSRESESQREDRDTRDTQRNALTVSGSSSERRVSWNESLRAPIRSGHVEEMRTKYGHRTAGRTASGRSVGAEVAVDEMGRAIGGRVQASTVGSLRRFR